jgi:hypothetical protein
MIFSLVKISHPTMIPRPIPQPQTAEHRRIRCSAIASSDRGTDVFDLRLFGRHCKCRRAQIVSCQPKDGRALAAGGTGDRRMAIGYGRVKT